MKHANLRRLIFLALCCDLGLFSKRLIAPAANILTDSLHIPGGITTAFSLMFLVLAAIMTRGFGWATLMAAVQSGLALSMGMVGSMGALAPIGYLVPGFMTDCVIWAGRKSRAGEEPTMLLANALASMSAALTANLLVFRLRAPVLLLYLSVALSTGALCGLLGGSLSKRLRPLIFAA